MPGIALLKGWQLKVTKHKLEGRWHGEGRRQYFQGRVVCAVRIRGKLRGDD